MQKDTFTLEELSRATGIRPRTIRSYIHQGLLRGPQSLGRGARYDSTQLTRLRAIGALKGRGLTLDEIRAHLLTLTDEEVESYADERVAGGTGSPDSLPENSGSALEYLRAIRASSGGSWSGGGIAGAQALPDGAVSEREQLFVEPSISASAYPGALRGGESSTTSTGTTPVDQLLALLSDLAGDHPVARRSKGEHWMRIPVTPDIEINVRGVRTPAHLARLEALADRFRDILLGGTAHDRQE